MTPQLERLTRRNVDENLIKHTNALMLYLLTEKPEWGVTPFNWNVNAVFKRNVSNKEACIKAMRKTLKTYVDGLDNYLFKLRVHTITFDRVSFPGDETGYEFEMGEDDVSVFFWLENKQGFPT